MKACSRKRSWCVVPQKRRKRKRSLPYCARFLRKPSIREGRKSNHCTSPKFRSEPEVKQGEKSLGRTTFSSNLGIDNSSENKKERNEKLDAKLRRG